MREVRKRANDDLYNIITIHQLIFIFDNDTGRFINVFTLENVSNALPGTLDINER